jgi:hypothetical protein
LPSDIVFGTIPEVEGLLESSLEESDEQESKNELAKIV